MGVERERDQRSLAQFVQELADEFLGDDGMRSSPAEVATKFIFPEITPWEVCQMELLENENGETMTELHEQQKAFQRACREATTKHYGRVL